MPITRFAPSPTGLLHLGHALSALVGWTRARAVGGRFLLRIEDIDTTRCRAEFEIALLEDLAWLGLDWDQPVRRQSEHFDDYRAALDRLHSMRLLYPCFCNRQEIAREVAAAAGAPQGPDGPLYPGTCRHLSAGEREAYLAAARSYALRLDMAAAVALAGELTWLDELAGLQRATPQAFGDVVLARKEIPTSYHLAVVVDDALQGVDLVTRGVDLFAATHVHRLLQALLGIQTQTWRHHALLTDENGQRLAKRHDAKAIRRYREDGFSPEAVRKLVGFP
ncbi:MAG: tRNA glutamyl-Q(34) synthetase GluQRS [Acidobacteriota bacterium]